MQALTSSSPAFIAAPQSPASGGRKEELGDEFEALFLAEMLKHAGLDEAIALDSGFGGDAMASFMVDQIARLMAQNDEFGVAELTTHELGRNR